MKIYVTTLIFTSNSSDVTGTKTLKYEYKYTWSNSEHSGQSCIPYFIQLQYTADCSYVGHGGGRY